MDKYYPFDINSNRMLMRMNINASWKFDDVYFQIHEMPDGSVKVFWRKGLSDRKHIEAAIMIEDRCFKGNRLPLSELVLTDEYKKEMLILSPINELVFSNEEQKLITDLCNKGIPDNYKTGGGRDGHSYDIWFENSKRYGLWCYVHKSLEPAADVINLLVSRAGLDEDMYGIKIKK